jgi:hypothetical protein
MSYQTQLDEDTMNIDDEEELLYGHLNAKGGSKLNESGFANEPSESAHFNDENLDKESANDSEQKNNCPDAKESLTESKKLVVTYWLLTVSSEGTLSIFSLKNSPEQVQEELMEDGEAAGVGEELKLCYSVVKFNMASKLLVLDNHLKLKEVNNSKVKLHLFWVYFEA